MADHPKTTRTSARLLFRRGYTVTEIEEELHVPAPTLYRWRQLDQWDYGIPAATVEELLSRRICLLLDMPEKTPEQTAELGMLIDKLGDFSRKLAMSRQTGRPAPAADDQEVKAADQEIKRNKRKRRIKNDISAITSEDLDEVRELLIRGVEPAEINKLRFEGVQPNPPIEDRRPWEYLRLWHFNKSRRNRFILKSRQIGATYWFAWEALEDAIATGDNQIFLSASRDQAEVFRAYIVMFASLCLVIDLRGNPIILSNSAELRFLATNSRTAQSYHGHLYLDEVFWVPKFKLLWKVASAMSAHKKWRRTLMSTPSALSHEAYEKWSGEEYNTGKPDVEKREFDISHQALKAGWMGPDRIWRHMLTVIDAERQGCNLFDIEELRAEYSEDDFNNLYMCQFIDDSKSVFPLWLLLKCCEHVSIETWQDYDEKKDRPYGNKPVSIGYDPARTVDRAALAKLAVPLRPEDKWRVLQRKSFFKQSFEYQATQLKDIVKSHNVVFLGIDVSGIGYGVYEHALGFYSAATPITYSVQSKTAMVVKGLEVMHGNRFEYNPGDKEITRAFLMIRQSTTEVTNQITYTSGRSNDAGHAEAAWAILDALSYEPINSGSLHNATTVAFSK